MTLLFYIVIVFPRGDKSSRRGHALHVECNYRIDEHVRACVRFGHVVAPPETPTTSPSDLLALMGADKDGASPVACCAKV